VLARKSQRKQVRGRQGDIDSDMAAWAVKTAHVRHTDQRRIKQMLLQRRETSNQLKFRKTSPPFFRRISTLNPRDATASRTHYQYIARPSSDTSPRAEQSLQGLPSITLRLHPPGFPKCVLRSCATPAHGAMIRGNQQARSR